MGMRGRAGGSGRRHSYRRGRGPRRVPRRRMRTCCNGAGWVVCRCRVRSPTTYLDPAKIEKAVLLNFACELLHRLLSSCMPRARSSTTDYHLEMPALREEPNAKDSRFHIYILSACAGCLPHILVACLTSVPVESTAAKALEVWRKVDQKVQLGKDGTLDAARCASAFVRGDDGVRKLFTELAYRYKENELQEAKPATPASPLQHRHHLCGFHLMHGQSLGLANNVQYLKFAQL